MSPGVARLAEKEVVVAVPETLLARAKSGEARVSIWSVPDRLYLDSVPGQY
jgi:hypothetical protein